MYLPLASLIISGVLSAPAAPGVSVTLSNDSGEVRQDSTVAYTIHVRNDSGTAYPGLLIAQMLPQTLSYRDSSAEPSAKRPFEVQWQRDLAAHSEIVLNFQASLSETVQAGATVSTTACVRPSEAAALVCSSAKDTVKPPSKFWWISGLLFGVAALTICAWWAVSRRKGQRRA